MGIHFRSLVTLPGDGGTETLPILSEAAALRTLIEDNTLSGVRSPLGSGKDDVLARIVVSVGTGPLLVWSCRDLLTDSIGGTKNQRVSGSVSAVGGVSDPAGDGRRQGRLAVLGGREDHCNHIRDYVVLVDREPGEKGSALGSSNTGLSSSMSSRRQRPARKER